MRMFLQTEKNIEKLKSYSRLYKMKHSVFSTIPQNPKRLEPFWRRLQVNNKIVQNFSQLTFLLSFMVSEIPIHTDITNLATQYKSSHISIIIPYFYWKNLQQFCWNSFRSNAGKQTATIKYTPKPLGGNSNTSDNSFGIKLFTSKLIILRKIY